MIVWQDMMIGQRIYPWCLSQLLVVSNEHTVNMFFKGQKKIAHSPRLVLCVKEMKIHCPLFCIMWFLSIHIVVWLGSIVDAAIILYS